MQSERDADWAEEESPAPEALGSFSVDEHQLLGLDGGLRPLASVLDRVAASSATVLLRGETGTGKEIVARELHRRSPRAGHAFVRTSCAALAEGVLESEFFGHEAGAYTGARGPRAGRFEEANEGTLFLDEIGDISPRVQVALLRVLEGNEFERVGSNRTLRVDVRVIVATHVSLEDRVRQMRFREDLFYRLNVVPLYLPPLRARRDDVAQLAHHFVDGFARRLKKQVVLSDAAVEVLSAFDWPGNVRQLRNVLERACVLAEPVATIEPEHLELGSHQTLGPGRLTSADEVMAEVEVNEAQRLLTALREAGGSKTRAATMLGIPRTTFTDRLRRLDGTSKESVPLVPGRRQGRLATTFRGHELMQPLG